jgi:hypothetical protein
MSVDYYVAVHQANWPPAAAVQACLVERGYPVRLESAPAEPLSSNGALAVRFHDRGVELEASTVQLSATKAYAYTLDRPPDLKAEGGVEVHKLRPDDVFAPADINKDLARIGAGGVRFGNGDYVLTMSFHSSTDETRAGLYLLAAMIHCFDGYGFEFQGGAHGGRAYADGLVADAADDAQWVRKPSSADDLSPETKRGLDEFLDYIHKSAEGASPR